MPFPISDPLAPYPDLTVPIIEELQVFLDRVEIGVFRNHLVELYMAYAVSKAEEFPLDFKNMTESVGLFLQFLNKVEREVRG